jgi:hypothetical protein
VQNWTPIQIKNKVRRRIYLINFFKFKFSPFVSYSVSEALRHVNRIRDQKFVFSSSLPIVLKYFRIWYIVSKSAHEKHVSNLTSIPIRSKQYLQNMCRGKVLFITFN